MQNQALFEVRNLSFSFNQKPILQSVSFSLYPNQVVGLVGLNGAGKSTLLKLMAGIYPLPLGHLFWQGQDLKQAPFLRQKDLGFLPQSLPLFPSLNTYEYLQLIGKLRQSHPAKIPQQLEDVIKGFGLADFLYQSMHTLSQGQRQRVGLAAAFLGKPRLILLDEPHHGLDPVQQQQLVQALRSHTQTSAFLISSHDTQFLENETHRLLRLNQGQLTESTYPDFSAKILASASPPERRAIRDLDTYSA